MLMVSVWSRARECRDLVKEWELRGVSWGVWRNEVRWDGLRGVWRLRVRDIRWSVMGAQEVVVALPLFDLFEFEELARWRVCGYDLLLWLALLDHVSA